jgi:CDP-diacylglycerol--glycerol-3-phosphate 3-phosphatidyltransferase
MNTANKLTMARVILIPIFLLILYLDIEYNGIHIGRYIALAVFIIAALTDYADGLIARKYNQITDFGKFMDPLADKVLTFAAMLWFVEVGMMPAWLVLIVIVREFMVTGIRLVAAAKGRVIAATMSGKVKTVVTIVCLIIMFFAEDLEAILVYLGIYFPLTNWLVILCWVLIGLTTLISGVEYLVKNRDIMRLEM